MEVTGFWDAVGVAMDIAFALGMVWVLGKLMIAAERAEKERER